MSKPLRREFDSVDRTTDPDDFVRYLDTTRAMDFLQEIKQRTFALMDLREGDHALDLGCGTGEDVCALAAKVGQSGRAVGVDISSTMITASRQRLGESGLKAEFLQGDVQNLTFEDSSFDAIRAERLLQHVPDTDAALREIVRIAKRGARIVIWEGDLDLLIIDAPDYETSRVMQRFICDSFRNGAIGHQLYRRFLSYGLVDVQTVPLVREVTDLALIENAFDLCASVERATQQNLLKPEQARTWLESLRSAGRSGQFLSVIGGFITFGRKKG